MIIFTNTKEVSTKILYDVLMSSFNEFYKDTVKKEIKLGFGVAEQNISVQQADGQEVYNLLITPDQIVMTPIHEEHDSIGKVLEKFINASLM